MKTVFATLLAVALAASAKQAFAHGFELLVNSDSNGNPTSVTEVSNQPVLDQDNSVSGPENLFLDTVSVQDSPRSMPVKSEPMRAVRRLSVPACHGRMPTSLC